MASILSLDGWANLTRWISKIGKGISVAAAILVYCVAAYLGIFVDAIRYIANRLIQLSDGDLGGLQNANFATLDFISYVNAVFPLSEFVGLMTIYGLAWTTLICIRWAKSFIPTIAN